ncbi:MAG: CvpA family protein [Clostridia bacterium]|nr:CvpA family protein [Clostridia bacterium]
MNWILDGIVILLLVISLILGYRRGFIRTAIQLAGYVFAFLVALSLSQTVAKFVYDGFIDEGIRQSIGTAFTENAGNTVTEKVEGVLDTLPDFLKTALSKNENVQNTLATITEKTENTVTAVTETIISQIIRPIVVTLLRFVAFLILFLLLLLIVALLGKLVKPVSKLPLIRQVDGTLGLLLGLVKGCVLSLVAVTVIQLIITSGSTTGPFTAENLKNSFLASWIADNNPLISMLKF